MKRQITQFDNARTSATVATPTCSSCCCCCCCLTTALASSTILARRINKEAREKQVADPIGLTILAALFLPLIGLITYSLYKIINHSIGSCSTRTYHSEYNNIQDYSYQICTNPANALLPAILIIVPILVLSYLYARVRMQKPVVRAIAVTAIIAIAGVAEAAAGAALILTGVGGIFYLMLVPVLFGVVQAFYGRKILHRDVTRKNSADAWHP